MNDLRPLPDDASDDESTSKLVDVEEECSTGVASSSVCGWGCASSCRRTEGQVRGIFTGFPPELEQLMHCSSFFFFCIWSICAYVLTGSRGLESAAQLFSLRGSSKQINLTPRVTCTPHLSWMLTWPALGGGVMWRSHGYLLMFCCPGLWFDLSVPVLSNSKSLYRQTSRCPEQRAETVQGGSSYLSRVWK